MHELQTRVANRIFPAVAAELNKKTEAFADFIDKFRIHLLTLSSEATERIARLEIGEKLKFDIGANLDSFLKETLGSLHDLVEGEETKIVALLEEFVDAQVEEKLEAARENVTAILGRGTTVAQTSEIRAFYREVRVILKDALKEHVRRRFGDFARHLADQANAVPDKTLSEVGAQIEQTALNIRAAAEAAIAGQKDAFERISGDLVSDLSAAQTEIFALLADGDADRAEMEPDEVVSVAHSPEVATESIAANIQAKATQCVQRHILQSGATRWPWSRIFPSKYLRGATQGWLIDPYLAKHHQRRNLDEFVVALLAEAKLKTLNVITREVSDLGEDSDRRYFDALDRDTFEKAGTRIVHRIDVEIHDRSFILDNGIVFKLGRGLDIYKPPITGLATRDPSLRKVQSCEIDVFEPAAQEM